MLFCVCGGEFRRIQLHFDSPDYILAIFSSSSVFFAKFAAKKQY